MLIKAEEETLIWCRVFTSQDIRSALTEIIKTASRKQEELDKVSF